MRELRRELGRDPFVPHFKQFSQFVSESRPNYTVKYAIYSVVQILEGAEAHVVDLREPLGPERIGGGGGRRQDDKGEGHGQEHSGASGSRLTQSLTGGLCPSTALSELCSHEFINYCKISEYHYNERYVGIQGT